MPNVFDSVPVESGNVFDSIPAEQPQPDLSKIGTNPLDVYKLQESKSPNLEDYSLAVPPSLNPNYDFLRATHGETILAPPLALLAKGLGSKNPEEAPFKPLVEFPTVSDEDLKNLPSWASKAGRVVNEINKTLTEFTAPVSLAKLPVSEGMAIPFGAQLAADIPGDVQDVVNSKDSDERTSNLSKLGIKLAMGAMLAHGYTKGEPKPSPVQGPYSLGRYLNMPKGAEPPLSVEGFEPLDAQSGSPLSPAELLARQRRVSTPPEAPEPEIKTWNLDEPPPSAKEWEELLKPNSERDLKDEGVTPENIKALLSGSKTPEQVVDEQLGIKKYGNSTDASTMIVEENPDGSRSIGFAPEAGPASTTPVNIGQMSHEDAIAMARQQGVERIKSILNKGGKNAPQIRQQPESNQPEHSRDAGERTPAQPSSGGGVEQRAEAPQANEPVTPPGDVGRIADQEASQITKQISDVSQMSGKDFSDFSRKVKGGMTGEAWRLGQSVESMEQLADLKSKQDAEAVKFQEAKKSGDLEAMSAAAVKRQFFREAYEAATGTGSAGKSLRDKNPNYKPPFPEGSEIQSAAIKVGDKIITGENHVAAYENARSQGVPDTSGATEGFVTNGGKFLNREEAAKSSGIPTTVEPGKLHTEDLSKSAQLVGMGAAKYGETGGPKTPLSELENQIHILAEQPKAGGQKEAFNLGTKIQTFRDGISENLQGLKAAGAYLREKLIGEPKVTDLKRAIGNRHLALTDSAINAREFVKNAEKKIPSKLSQEAISDYVDAGGNEEVLRRAAAETKPKYRAGYEAALNLTQDQKTVANNIKQYFDARLDDAIKNGILEDGIEDYLHRYYESDSPWKNGVLAELKSGIFTGKPALAKQRVFDYDFEAEKAGLNPVKSFIKRVAAYDLSLNKAIADRNIVKEMSQIKMTDGRPMVDVAGSGVKVGGPVQGQGATLIKPSAKPNSENPIDNRNDYKPFDAPALRKWKWVGTDENGNPVMLQGDVLVHPDAIKDVRALFERSRVRANPVGRVALGASSTVKQTMLDISAFHPVQIAVHGLEHRSNVPFGEYDAKFLGREFRPLTDYINDPQVRGLVRGGMVIGETTGRELFHEGLSGSSLTKHIPGVGPKLAQYSDWLFNDYIPRLKAETGLHALSRNRQRYPNLSEDQLNHLTANQMNAAFGEQNYEMIGRSKTTQDMLRLALLAPDFLESRLKFAGQAATKYGREQLTALMLGAATMYIVARLLNKALDDEYHFEPRNAFSVIKNGKAYSLRTVQGDILQAATDPEKFLRHRLNPLYGRTAMEAITQRDEFGRTRNAQQQLKDFATTIVPISFRGLLNPREQNLMESVLNAVGVTEHRASPTTLVYDLANKYKKEKKIGQEPGEFIYDPDKDPYRPIRQAAIFSNPQTVAKEIARAVKEGKKPEELVKHFQRYATAPFTGSKKNEPKFFQSLDSDNQKIYQDAKAEKKKILQNFQTGLAIYRRSGGNP